MAEPVGELSEEYSALIAEAFDNIILPNLNNPRSRRSSKNHPDDKDLVVAEFENINICNYIDSVQLIDENEEITMSDLESFLTKLRISESDDVTVVSVFGTSGCGKSYFLNKYLDSTDREIFKKCKTIGAWGVYDQFEKILYIDTQAFVTSEKNMILIKIFAVSDIIIFRTKSPSSDMHIFLGQASDALENHFKNILKFVNKDDATEFKGPTVFICLEEHSEDVIKTNNTEVKKKISELNYDINGLGEIFYIPIPKHDQHDGPNFFATVKNYIYHFMSTTTHNISHKPIQIFESLEILSNVFQGKLICGMTCVSCKSRCELSAEHLMQSGDHSSERDCSYVQHYKNKETFCRKCHNKVNHTPSKQWWDYIGIHYDISCDNCGVIYRSTDNEKEDDVTYSKIVHVWPDKEYYLNAKSSTAMRKAFEFAQNICGTVSGLATDYIAPKYWERDVNITHCTLCCTKISKLLKNIHHCRACGKGVCDNCSRSRKTVYHRGWNTPSRICDSCVKFISIKNFRYEPENITPRIVTESVINSIKPLIAIGAGCSTVVTDLVRPSYWGKDALRCDACAQVTFDNSPENARHHCRRCGKSVCDNCSPHREPVPEMGFYLPSRVCNDCTTKSS